MSNWQKESPQSRAAGGGYVSNRKQHTSGRKAAASGKKLEMTPAEKSAVVPAAFEVRKAQLATVRGSVDLLREDLEEQLYRLPPKELRRRAEAQLSAAAHVHSPRKDDAQFDLGKKVAKKTQDPLGNPTMTIREVCHTFSKSKATVYRWIEEGKLVKAGTPGSVRTDSVIRLLQPPPEQ